MRLPGWICPTCEKPFPRRWNAERHLYTQHPDESTQIVIMVDYLAARLSGVYMASCRKGAPQPDLAQFKPSNICEFLQDVTPYPAEYTKRYPVTAVKTRKSVTHTCRMFFVFLNHGKDTNKVKA